MWDVKKKERCSAQSLNHRCSYIHTYSLTNSHSLSLINYDSTHTHTLTLSVSKQGLIQLVPMEYLLEKRYSME